MEEGHGDACRLTAFAPSLSICAVMATAPGPMTAPMTLSISLATWSHVAGALDRKPALIGASLGGLAGIMAEGEVAPGSFASLTLVDITPQMEASGVARVVGFMAAHAREGFASPEEAARVISEYLPHRPSRKASSGLAHYLRQKATVAITGIGIPAFIDGIMRRHCRDAAMARLWRKRTRAKPPRGSRFRST
jgi:hypothetical protein